MNCPEDSTPLELVLNGIDTEYHCSLCGGKLINTGQTSALFDSDKNTPKVDSPEHYLCPKDHDQMEFDGKDYACKSCLNVWTKGTGPNNVKQLAGNFVGQIVLLLVVGVGLFAWQLGSFTTSADSMTQLSNAPIKGVALIVWFFIFLILFSLPMTVYIHMIKSHRPHFGRSVNHPWVRYGFILVIALMAATVYFLTQ